MSKNSTLMNERTIILDKEFTNYNKVKRVLDIFISIITLLLVSPLLILVSIIIKIDSNGPIIFKQVRAGEKGKPFIMYKFRTMIPDAEKVLNNYINIDSLDEPVFKIRNDPRITKVGKFLRKSSIDELPQLINVIKGEMSLIGPRPEEKLLTDRYNEYQSQRLAIKPGLSGWQQVHCRADVSLSKRIEYDLFYINNRSLLLDIKIILLTLKVIFLGRGAY